MKKQKIFYLDFIRVVSMFVIVTYHFYAHFAENNITGTVIPFANGKWGIIGVALFFMISGASLMYNYGEQIDVKKYFIKRFLGIFPMYWLAYAILFIYLFYQSKGVPTAAPLYRLIFTVFGMDGYLSCYTETIYLIGEWFLGCIILLYILFPFLRAAVKKYPVTTFVVATILNFALLLFYRQGTMPISRNIIISAYSFLLGMYVVKIKRISWWHAVIAFVLAIIFYKLPTNGNMLVLSTRMVAYLLYIVLAYIGQKINNITLQTVIAIVAKYSYAVFLVHHYLIMKILSTFQGRAFGIAGTGLLYLVCWVQIAIIAKVLCVANKEILNLFKKNN